MLRRPGDAKSHFYYARTKPLEMCHKPINLNRREKDSIP